MMSRNKCPLCENSLIGTLNTRYCRNPKCELYDEPLQGRLLDIIAETQALFDKEMKDHWHKHQIALRLKEQVKILTDALNNILELDSNKFSKQAVWEIARTTRQKIKELEQKYK